MQFKLDDYNKNDEYNCYILSNDILNKIKELESLIVVTDIKKGRIERTRVNKKQEIESDWETIRNFKTTKILDDNMNIVDKSLNEIRKTLNKISTKNINNQLEVIELNVKMIFDNEENKLENMEKTKKLITNVCCSSKNFSNLFAIIYKKLSDNYDLFSDGINEIIQDYKNSILTIEYIDPEKDYDEYCKYNKKNDIRKTTSLFILNLMKVKLITKEEFINLILYLLSLVEEYSVMDDKKNEIEEIIENLYILIVTDFKEICDEEVCRDKVIPNINHISNMKKLKAQEYKSITNRASFRCMDIIDSVK